MIDLAAYFRRIGYDGPCAPTLDVLSALHRLHPAAIPYEGTAALVGAPIDIAPEVIFEKMVARRRGGYCFEHNTLFREVLRQLGFEVTSHMGRVLWFLGADDPLPLRTHMAMKVAVDGVDWLADVGFGGATMLAPIRMWETAPQATINGTFRLMRVGEHELKLELRTPRRWMPMVLLSLEPQLDVDFLAPNWYTSTYPGSTFKRRLMACRSMPDVRHALLNNRYTIRTPDGAAEERMLDRAKLEQVLREVFDVEVTDALRAALERVVWGK